MASISKEQKLLNLIETSGYNIVQENGQRIYGPPPDWEECRSPPEKGCEVFVGRIPRDCYEDELVPLFARIGTIYQLRLMMDFSGYNRGYAFVTFTNQRDAKLAIQLLNEFEIRPNKRLGVVKSIDNCRLFIGNIPLNKSRKDVIQELQKVTEGVVNAIVYYNSNDKLIANGLDKQKTNRGFAFVEYCSHRAAAMARRKLLPGKVHLFGCEITVDWAIPEPTVDEETMSKVTVLFVRYLNSGVSEDYVKEIFSINGSLNIQRVKIIKNYAFVHFYCREDAEFALKMLPIIDLSRIGSETGQQIEVTWAKPPNAFNSAHKNKIANFNNSVNDSYIDSVNNSFDSNYGSLLNPMATPFRPSGLIGISSYLDLFASFNSLSI